MKRQLSAEIARYDLHLHTWWSYDATAEVEAHFQRALELGIECIAITDHHHLDSLPFVLEMAKRFPEVRAIAAAELSVTTSLGAVDLLCYNLSTRIADSPLGPVVARYHEWQREVGAAVSAGMCQLGYPYPDEVRLELLRTYRPEEAIELQGGTHVNNSVQRKFFLKQGFISREEEYPGLIARVAKTVTIPPYPAVEEVVEAVHAANGLVAIAHPQGYFGGADPQRMDRLREECRFDGIECAHPAIAPEYTPVYREYCLRHGLFSVGGSDAHTADDIQAMMGRHGGEGAWLDEFIERIGPAPGDRQDN